jgi:trehalose 6-phosphate synthase/phosphatase
MGIDYEKYAHPEVDAEHDKDSLEIRDLAKHRKIIVSIDRLDYTKGIPQRIKAFALFLKRYPEYHGKVNLVMLVVPSRSNVDTYKNLKAEVDTLVSEVNSEYSRFNWIPIRYYYRSLNFAALTTLYRYSDIALITPLRDGMNLVAKEYIAAKEDSKNGVLILSEMAGAANELNDALTVNPQDANKIVEALVTALEMPLEEQTMRMSRMQEQLKIYNVKQWAANFIQQQQRLKTENLEHTTTKLKGEVADTVLEEYRAAKRRLFIIDYDGTMMDFHVDPQAVSPDEEVLEILNGLAADPKNMVVVNSGRDRTTLQKWLGDLPIEMSAEHGVWMKEKGEWELNPNVSDGWKPNVREVLENLVSRTPGSFIEEKDYSLAWHYRGIDREFGEARVREFRDVLAYLIQNQDLQVLEGNKVVEIKNSGVNKGKATKYWLGRDKFDFVFGIGDDSTDEDIFKAMPNGVSVKVGIGHTDAKYMLRGVKYVRSFFRKLLSK